MDNRLVLAILFLMLSWISVGTYAQTSAAPNNVTSTVMTAAPTTSHMTSTMGNNMTSATDATTTTHMTSTMGNDMTSATDATTTTHMTSTMGNDMTSATDATTTTHMTSTMGNDMTSATDATTTTHMTSTMGNSMTSATDATTTTHMTSTMGNSMTSATDATTTTHMTSTMGNDMTSATDATTATHMTTTMGNNTNNTSAAPTTTSPSVIVSLLETPVNNSGCGTQQLCAAEPSSCDPSNDGSCFFLAARRQSGQNFECALSGGSDGYIAASLSTDSAVGENDITFVCANNNGNVLFFGALLNNGQLTQTVLDVNTVRGRVTGRRIQCTFVAAVPASLARTPNVAITVSNGTFDSASGTLGTPMLQIRTPTVDLGNPNATVTNELSTTTTSAPTGHATTLQQSLTQALLISVGVLSLAML